MSVSILRLKHPYCTQRSRAGAQDVVVSVGISLSYTASPFALASLHRLSIYRPRPTLCGVRVRTLAK